MRAIALLVLAGLPLLGCQSAVAPTSPAAQQEEGDPNTSIPSWEGFGESGVYLSPVVQVRIDPATLTAWVDVQRSASAQPPQAIYYDFDIANFLNSESFVVTGVSLDEFGDFVLDFTHAHPFPAPDVGAPISGINRADLGYTGRLLVLSSGPPELFFDGTVRLDPNLVKFPDGYVNPGDLLQNDTFRLANTFPYVLLADDGEDNRVGVSNGGDPEGSYAAAFGGWQRNNLGPEATGWTGFDFIHGGQTIENQLVFSREALEGNNNVVDLVFLIKYTDPRGAGGPNNRLPGEDIDESAFAYRLPYAALDNSVINITDPLVPQNTCCSWTDTLEISIRDWDTRADEAGDADLSDETDVSLIQPGASGIPSVRFDVSFLDEPVVLTGLRGSGLIGDEMEYGADIRNDDPTPGNFIGLIEVVDNENGLDRSNYHFGVDPDTVLPDQSRALDAITYQVIPYSQPFQVMSVEPGGTFTQFDEAVFSVNTIGGEPTDYNWQFAGGANVQGSLAQANPPVVFSGEPGVYTGRVTVSQGGLELPPFEFEYRIVPPPLPRFTDYILTSSDFSALGKDVQIVEEDGRPSVAYEATSETGLIIGRASEAQPGSNDWDMHLIEPGSDVMDVRLEVFDSRLVTSYHHTISGDLWFTYAEIDDPVSASDFSSYAVDDLPTLKGFNGEILVEANRIVIAHVDLSTNDISIARTDSGAGMPTSAGQWTTYRFASSNVEGGFADIAGSASGSLILGYSNLTENDIDVRVTDVTDPAISDWFTPYTLHAGEGTVQLERIGFLIGAVTVTDSERELWYHRAKVSAPINSSSWDRMLLHFQDGAPILTYDLAEVFSREVITWQSNPSADVAQVHVMKSHAPTPFDYAHWTGPQLLYQSANLPHVGENEDIAIMAMTRGTANQFPLILRARDVW